MKFVNKIIVLLSSVSAIGSAQADCNIDTIFKNGMEAYSVPGTLTKLNDTGITWSGDVPSGNSLSCDNASIPDDQDCNQGRDFIHDDDSDGHAGFSFTKLDANGNNLPASASSWTCVKDNVTGLTWEVKSLDGGVHHNENIYHWGGVTSQGCGWGIYPTTNSWDFLVNDSNADNFCGHNDWRLPTVDELKSIVDHSQQDPSIDIDYFPNSMSSHYWSANPYFFDATQSYTVSFSNGLLTGTSRDNVQVRVRLVR